MTQPITAAGSRSPIYSTDMARKAANCTVPLVTLEDGKTTAAAIATGGGGWCGIHLRRADQPYGAGLLTQHPTKGDVYVHTVGDDTRVDYTPRAGTTGADSFTVEFIPGAAKMQVTVNAAAPAGAAK